MTKEELIKKAWNYIANEDETSRIIPDGNIDDAAELIADFIISLEILPEESTKDKQSEQKNLCINYNDCRYSKKYPADCINNTKHHCYRA